MPSQTASFFSSSFQVVPFKFQCYYLENGAKVSQYGGKSERARERERKKMKRCARTIFINFIGRRKLPLCRASFPILDCNI